MKSGADPREILWVSQTVAHTLLRKTWDDRYSRYKGTVMLARRLMGIFKPESSRRRRWILVTNRSSARIFEQDPTTHRLTLVEQLEHPDQGRLLLEEINKGRPKASALSDVPPGVLRFAKSVETSNANDEAKRFAKVIDHALKEGRRKKQFDELVVVAEPSYLGLLLGRLDRGILNLVVEKVHKDLAAFSDAQVKRYFDKDWRQNERYRSPIGVNLG